jgi:hypothetical protein
MFGYFAVLAKFERELTVERTKAVSPPLVPAAAMAAGR